MKIQATILIFSFILFLSGCGAGHLSEPFATSDGYGSITINQDSIRENMFQKFPAPTITGQQAVTLAWQRCSNWEFDGVEPFGAWRHQTVNWGPGLNYGEQVPMTIRYSLDFQCTGNPANQ